jgi:hypothetical protein
MVMHDRAPSNERLRPRRISPTHLILERRIGSLVSCVILQITRIVLLYIMLAVEQQVTAR